MKKTNMGVSDQVEKNPSSRPGTPGLGYGRFFVHKDPSSVKISPSRAPLTASSASMIKSSTTTAAATPSATTTTSALPSTATSLSRPASAPATAGATNDPPTFFTKPTASRAKSIIMLNNKPIAVSMKSDKPEPETPVPSAAPPKLKQPAPTKQSTESENPLKFRMWAPREQRKSILVSIGQRMAQMRAERIFDSSQMRTKTYNEWRKEAQAQLPSMTGGAVVEKLADALHAAPILQKENTKKTMQIIRRLSEGSEKKPLIPEPRKSSGVDYTKIREVRLSVKSEDTTSSDESTDTVVEIDNEQEIARLEYERKQAGIDFKAKIQTLKQLADHLSNKRAVRQQLVQKATGFTVLDAEEIPIKEHILYAIEYMGDLVHDAFTYLILWEKQIREINGKYGVVTANYFTWVREMIGLELLGFFFVIVIIMIPQFFQQNYGEFENEGSSVPKGVVHDELRHFHITDLIHGEGYFHYSYLYYTGYHRRNEDSANPFENPAFRFLFCLFVEFIVLTYFIFSRLTKYYQSARMESTVSGVANVETFKTVVCGWDYSCRDEQGAAYLHQTIFRELKFLARKHTVKVMCLVSIFCMNLGIRFGCVMGLVFGVGDKRTRSRRRVIHCELAVERSVQSNF